MTCKNGGSSAASTKFCCASASTGNVETDRIQFALNGQILPDDLRRKINSLYNMDGPRYRVMGGYWHIFQNWTRRTGRCGGKTALK